MLTIRSIRDWLKARAQESPPAAAKEGPAVNLDDAPTSPVPTTINTADELAAAAEWLTWLKFRREKLQAEFDQAFAILVQCQNRELALPAIETDVLKLYAAVEAAVVDYARRTPALFADAQSHRIPGATIKRKKRPLAIETTLKGDALETEYGRTLKIHEALDRFHGKADPKVALLLKLCRIKVEPHKQHIAEQYKQGTVSAQELKEVHLKPSDVDQAGDGHNYSVEL
jgi:hypothetical protein